MSEPTLTSAPEPNDPTVTVAEGAAAPGADTLSAPPGYELHSLIGSGGMGSVYRARHLSLTRDVAIKFLLNRYAPDSVTAWRFVEEARITAQLQHPGIPPVHEVGTLPDGRPYLAMKLIKGHTLDALLNDRNALVEQRGRFVAVFEQIAQAVGYAHSRRIIHRDLKPANVMVGDFGEVQVMDWGLAKELGAEAPASPARGDETLSVELRLGRDGGDVTQAGSLLGTPAFMPPEQAVGAIDQVNERSDVFGLGAILCVILTGKAPFVAQTAEATRVLAARGKLDDCFARLDASGAEPELIALAKRCLAPEASDRPANAGAVAEAVAAMRADAERRARQAEMDRATAEVKTAEERKRRRVQRVLALSLLVLLGVAGYTVRRIDNEQARQRTDREAQQRRQAEAEKDRANALKARQLVTERDVSAALNEVQVLREQGLKQADDPERWALTLVAARSSFKRAESLLASGEPTDEPVLKVAAAGADLTRDERDRALLAELDRIADNNEIRLLIPVSLTTVVSRQYAAAFRASGIDLLEVPTADAVAWLKNQRFRDRLVIAVRGWMHALSPTEGAGFEIDGVPGPNPPGVGRKAGSGNPNKILSALLLVTRPAPQTNKRTRRERLDAILTEVVDDPFTREWWDAVAGYNLPALKKLVTRPELNRMSSRELASLSDGLPAFGNSEVQNQLLALAHERFPGEFWVHFRLAFMAGNSKDAQFEAVRHLTAAVAARPRSGIARAALGMELLERRKDPFGLRLLKSASEVDPTTPWPHLFLGMKAIEDGNWTEAAAALKGAIRTDPDSAYFLIHTTVLVFSRTSPAPDVPDEHVSRLIEDLAAVNPEHPGGFDLLGELRMKQRNHRAALVAFRTASRLSGTDYPRKPLIDYQLVYLESLARWEGKIDAVLSGQLKPASSAEIGEIAGYCALFEQKYARAADFAIKGLKADPKFFASWGEAAKFAGWAVRAGSGHGADAGLTPAQRAEYRRQALAWLRASLKDVPRASAPGFGSFLRSIPDFDPVRDVKQRASLPPDELNEWIAFWAEVQPVPPPVPPKPQPHEPAPPPRPVK